MRSIEDYCKCWELRIFKKPPDEFWNYNLWLTEVKKIAIVGCNFDVHVIEKQRKTFSYETSYDTEKNNLFHEAWY